MLIINGGFYCKITPDLVKNFQVGDRSGFDLSRATNALLPDLAQMFAPDWGPMSTPDLASAWYRSGRVCLVWLCLLETHVAQSGSDVSHMKWLSGSICLLVHEIVETKFT